VQIGDGNFQVNLFVPTSAAARSGYLYQVRALAPATLKDRHTELAELRAFCTGPDAGDYLWWCGEAWAGKTALLSSFVLDPPPAVCVISFFVTARFAAQNDRNAFLDLVIEQLAVLLDEQVPEHLTPATRASHFWAALDAAAVACRERGQRLVLVVDGLDEDQGAAEHSIAALLPAHPPAGMRIVVAGRSNPPPPADLPEGHPLLDPAVKQVLAASPRARVIRRDALSDLMGLLDGPSAGRELLGLVTAAGGGLSVQDLAELTGRPGWEIEESLRSKKGRTFGRRPSAAASSGHEVFILAHEELQQIAIERLGAPGLAEYRQLLHTWAEGYQQENWPAVTPEYLSVGYFRMLRSVGDLPRMTSCALDQTRHEWMLAVTGADAAALDEIATVQGAIADCDAPDLRAAAVLAVRRGKLAHRNWHLPANLPAVWVYLGRPWRAEAQARSIPLLPDQCDALCMVIRALLESGDRSRARALVEELTIRATDVTSTNPESSLSRDQVIRSLAESGCCDEAKALADAVTDPRQRSHVLGEIAVAFARAGKIAQAEELAVRSSDRMWALREAAVALARAGKFTQAEEIVGRINDSNEQSMAVEQIVRRLVAAGKPRRAEEVANRYGPSGSQVRFTLAKGAAVSVGPGEQEFSLLARTVAKFNRDVAASREGWRPMGNMDEKFAEVVNVMAAIGKVGEHEAWKLGELARTLTVAQEEAAALAEVARAWALARSFERAEEVVREAEALARSITIPSQEEIDLSAISRACAQAGYNERAEELARGIPVAFSRACALGVVARAWVNSGQIDRADELARSIVGGDQGDSVSVLTSIARGWVKEGNLDRARAVLLEAEELARRTGWGSGRPTSNRPSRWIVNVLERTHVLDGVASAWAEIGDPDHAEEMVRSFDAPHGEALTRLIRMFADRGDVDHAETLVRDCASRGETSLRALHELARAYAEAGDITRANAVIRDAEDRTQGIADSFDRAGALVGVMRSWAQVGNRDRADTIGRQVLDIARRSPLHGGTFIRSMTDAWVEAADVDRARHMAQQAEGFALSTAKRDGQEWALYYATLAWAEVPEIDHAEELISKITTSSEIKAKALLGLAGKATPAHARSLIARALRVDSWSNALDALVTVEPEVLPEIAGEF
jgi:tetratricopeptide (TPR) repeat protein